MTSNGFSAMPTGFPMSQVEVQTRRAPPLPISIRLYCPSLKAESHRVEPLSGSARRTLLGTFVVFHASRVNHFTYRIVSVIR
jgi:hypothetical protein